MWGCWVKRPLSLCLFNLENIHRTCFYADAAGDTFAYCLCFFCFYHYAEWTDFFTFSAAYTFLLVDHVYALWILSDGTLRTDFCAFSALYAYNWFRAYAVFLYRNFDAGKILVKFLVKCLLTGNFTCLACHTCIFFCYVKLFHFDFLRFCNIYDSCFILPNRWN